MCYEIRDQLAHRFGQSARDERLSNHKTPEPICECRDSDLKPGFVNIAASWNEVEPAPIVDPLFLRNGEGCSANGRSGLRSTTSS